MTISAIQDANDKAQRLFKLMLDYQIGTGEWNPTLVDAYLNAEENVRWEVSKARLDELQAADHTAHEEPVESCYDCQEKVADLWQRVMAPY